MEILSQLMCILAVFGLLGLTLWWLKKKGAIRLGAIGGWRLSAGRNSGADKLLERIDGLQLSPTHSLSLVRMADRAVLIGISPTGFHVVESSSWQSLQSQTKREMEQ